MSGSAISAANPELVPQAHGGALKRGNVVRVGRKPNPVRKAMRHVSIEAAKTAERLMRADDFEQVKFALQWAGRHGIGTVDARVAATAAPQQQQAQNVNVGFQVLGPNDPVDPNEIKL